MILLCLIFGFIAAMSEEWDIVFICLILGSCAAAH
jgi:hypothetical protein